MRRLRHPPLRAPFPIDFAAIAPKSRRLAPRSAIRPDLQPRPGLSLLLSRRSRSVLGALILLPWLVVVLLLLPRFTPRPPAVIPAAAPPYDEYLHAAKPGPWGELQYSRLVIEPPEEFAPQDYTVPDHVRWVFKDHTPAMLAELWQAAALSPGEIAALSAPAAQELRPNAIVVKPSAELVRHLSLPARTLIYTRLSAFLENPDQNEPFRFRADNADEWFENSGLAPATLALVKPLLYRRGTSLLFSDHDVVLPLLPSAAERVRLIKTLARKSTLLVRLRITPQSDLAALVDYWGRGPRRKGLRAFLQSLAHRPRGMTVDLAHLLPRFPRAHLFTYPLASDHPEDSNHDCHWTSLNFFNDPPDERFADAAVVKQTFERDYVQVGGPPALGDVFVFSRPDGRVVHSCVYVAEDIVFTKNGASEVMPWILMNLSDVIAFYPADPPLTLHSYRRKDL